MVETDSGARKSAGEIMRYAEKAASSFLLAYPAPVRRS